VQKSPFGVKQIKRAVKYKSVFPTIIFRYAKKIGTQFNFFDCAAKGETSIAKKCALWLFLLYMPKQ
jgi:hypothetical protein